MKNKFGMTLAALAACFALGLPAQSALAKTHLVACKDGTHAKAGRGACSGHGGVAMAASRVIAKEKPKAEVEAKAKAKAKESAKKVEAKPKHEWAKKLKGKMEGHKAATHEAAKTPAKAGAAGAAGATARCKDGTYSHAKTHRGACSGHGGVAEWMKH